MGVTNKNLVVIGAGYGGLTAALRLSWLFRRQPEYRVQLIDKYPYHTLKTQLHEAAVRKANVVVPIERVLARPNITFRIGEVKTIDLRRKAVGIEEDAVPFERLVLAMGSEVNYYNIPGLAEHSLPLQSREDAQRIFEHISRMCAQAASLSDRAARRNMLRFVIGGGGLSGIEFAGELADHLMLCTRNYDPVPS